MVLIGEINDFVSFGPFNGFFFNKKKKILHFLKK